jgi:hypothetical protein
MTNQANTITPVRTGKYIRPELKGGIRCFMIRKGQIEDFSMLSAIYMMLGKHSGSDKKAHYVRELKALYCNMEKDEDIKSDGRYEGLMHRIENYLEKENTYEKYDDENT